MISAQTRTKATPMIETNMFPTAWETPHEANAFWMQARMHAPDPVPHLFMSLLLEANDEGSYRAMSHYGLPFERLAMRRVNTYLYSALLPSTADPVLFHQQLQAADAAIGATADHLGDQWHNHWLPAVQAHLAHWETQPQTQPTPGQLQMQLLDARERAIDLWNIHFQLAYALAVSFERFTNFCGRHLPHLNELDVMTLTTGFDNKSLERDRALWQLSLKVAQEPKLRACFGNSQAAAVIPQLEQQAEGRVFLAELQTFLRSFGFSGQPPWRQDPTPVIRMIQKYLEQPERDLEAEMAATTAKREAAIAAARAHLATASDQIRGQFEQQLTSAQDANFLGEEHAYWIDERAMYYVMGSAYQAGGLLAARGQLAAAPQVVHLTVAEILELIDSGAAAHALVTERAAELGRWATVTPPPTLGQPPAGPLPDSMFLRGMFRFFGMPIEPEPETQTIKGTPGAAGIIKGRACVVRSYEEARARLQAGDILVAPNTSPMWTPFFSIVAGIVTDTGGMLSHTACVAREYGIPAVVGTGVAVTQIPDGALVEINGEKGVVTILG